MTADQELFYTLVDDDVVTQLPLFNPASGEITDHYLLVRSTCSSKYEKAKRRITQVMLDKKLNSAIDKRSNSHDDGWESFDWTLSLATALVAGWSFEEEPSEKNIKHFLEKCPQIREQVESAAADQELFVERKKKS